MKASGRLVHVKDTLTRPTKSGYRDLKVYLDYNGHVAEVQILFPEMREALSKGHRIYREARALSPERRGQLEERMRALYADAWARLNERLSSSKAERSIGTASRTNSSHARGRGSGVQTRISSPRRETGAQSQSNSSASVGGLLRELELPSTQGSLTQRLRDVRPTEKFSETYLRSAASATRAEDILVDVGELTREQAATRKHQPGRLIGGERPRTEAEARSRLAKLEAEYDKLVDAITQHLTGGVHDADEQARRNLQNMRRGRGKRRGLAKLPTVKQEVRQLAEAELHKIAAKRSDDPQVAAIRDLIEERQALRDALNDPEHVFGGAALGDVGSVRERAEFRKATLADSKVSNFTTLGRKVRGGANGKLGVVTSLDTEKGTVRVRFFSGKSAKTFSLDEVTPASRDAIRKGRIVGAEDFKGGDIFTSYRKRHPRFGRPQVGNRQAIGIPLRPEATRNRFTGGSLRSGDFRDDTIAAIAEHELAAQRFQMVIRGREIAGRESISGEDYLALPPGERKYYIHFRLQTKPYSREARELLDLIQAKAQSGERLSRQERRLLENRVDTFRKEVFPELDEAQALAEAARGELRFVDERRLGGLNRREGFATEGGKAAAQLADEVNAANSVALLFLKVTGYLAPNLAGQTLLATIHQGFAAPVNLARAVKLYRQLGPEEQATLRVAAGLGFAKSIEVERSRLIRPVRDVLANAYSKVLDSPWRWAAFIHEARKLGYRTPAQMRELLMDPATRGDLVEAAQRTRDAMVDFERHGPNERKIVRRVVMFYPWVKGSTLYTGRFVRDHPIQAATMAQLGRKGEKDAKRLLGNVPGFARGIFPIGLDSLGRPLVVDPRSAGLFGSPAELGTALANINETRPPISLESFLSAPAEALIQGIVPHDTLEGYALPRSEAFRREYVDANPVARLVRGLRHPNDEDEDVLYPASKKTAAGRFLVGGLYPHPVNLGNLNAKAKAEAMADLNSGQRAVMRVRDDQREFLAAAKEHLPDIVQDGRLPAPLRTAFDVRARRYATLARLEATKGRDNVTQLDRLKVDVGLMRQLRKISPSEQREVLVAARRLSDDQIESLRARFASSVFGGGVIAAYRRALVASGADL